MKIALWIQLVVIIGFLVFVGFQEMWLIAAIAVALGLVTVWQLVQVYRRDRDITSQ